MSVQAVVNMILPNYMEEERLFIHNLTILGDTVQAVSFEIMVNTLMYISKNAVTEATFIGANYLGKLFDDEEFLDQGKIYICELDCLVKRYDEAKRNSDGEFLTLLRRKHRQAREFLDNDSMKERIHNLIALRNASMEKRAIWSTFVNLFGLLQLFPTSAIGQFLAPQMPQLMQTVPQLTNPSSDPQSQASEVVLHK